MKNKIYYWGIVSCILITLGGLFKIFHWPTAGIQLLIGMIILCFVFMPLAFLSSYKVEKNKKLKTLYILVFIVLVIDFLGVLFKINNWPGSSWVIPVTLPLVFVVLLPAYVLYNRNDKEINYNNFLAVMFFFAYFAAISALLALNISRSMVDAAAHSSYKLDSQSELIATYNRFLKNETIDTADVSTISPQEGTTSEMVIAYIEKIKLKLAKEEGGYNLPVNTETMNYMAIERKDARLGTTLLNEDAPVLKDMVEKYRQSILAGVKNEKAREQIKQLLSTTSNYAKDWEYELFGGRNLILALQELNVIKYKVVMAENIAFLD